MNCTDAKQKILLQSSGELSSTDADILEQHLRKCTLCQEFKQSFDKISFIALNAMPTAMPSDKTMDCIKQQASKKYYRRVLIFRKPFIKWAVAAAIIMIAVSNWPLIRNITKNNNSEISNMYAVLTIMTYPTEIIENNDTVSDIPKMEDLFQKFDNTPEAEIFPTEEILQVPPAKSPQSRNSYGHPLKIYG